MSEDSKNAPSIEDFVARLAGNPAGHDDDGASDNTAPTAENGTPDPAVQAPHEPATPADIQEPGTPESGPSVSRAAVDIENNGAGSDKIDGLVSPPQAESSASVTEDKGSSDLPSVASEPAPLDSIPAVAPASTHGHAEGDLFPPPPLAVGEFRLALDLLQVGKDHPRRDYDFEKGVGKALVHAALDHERLAPIVVMAVGDAWFVVDGWARVMALRFQFGGTANVMVRVVAWNGTERDAIRHRFDQTFLTLGSRKIELARLLCRMSELWGVPQLLLAARIGWTESKVTRHLIAAEGERAQPRFSQLLLKPNDPPIDYLYRVGKALRDAAADDASHSRRSADKGMVAALTGNLDGLLAKKKRFDPKAALVALGIAEAADEPGLPFETGIAPKKSVPVDAVELDPITGHDDVQIGALELHADDQPRLLLPADPGGMTAIEKDAARAAFHAAIDKYFS